MFKSRLGICFFACYFVALSSLASCSDTPGTESERNLRGEDSTQLVNTGVVPPRKVLSIDLSTIPDQLVLSEGSVSLSPQVVYTDQSKDEQVSISVDDPSILSINKEGVATPLKPGKVTLFFYATYDSNVRRNKTLLITTQATSDADPQSGSQSAEPPASEASSPPSVGILGVSSQEQKLYQPYFLKHYAVGMKWTYALTLDGITVSTSLASLPESLNLGWGMVLKGFAEKGLEASISNYLDAHKAVGTYTIEVLDVSEDSVLLQTELQSNIAGLPGQPLQQKRYTPETIAEVYVGAMASSLPERRRTVLNNPLTFRESHHTGSRTLHLTDEIKTVASLSMGFTNREESLTWVNNQVGLLRKEIRQNGSQNDLLGVQTVLALTLTDLQGFE